MLEIAKPDEAELERLARGELTEDNLCWSWWGGFRNFGDWIGPYIYMKRTGRTPRHCTVAHVPEGVEVLYTCGSLLHKVNRPRRAVIWGTGTIGAEMPLRRPKRVHALRGPLSQQALDAQGYRVPDVLGDPGLCLPMFYTPEQTAKTCRLGIIPHVSEERFWRDMARYLPPDVKIIDLKQPLETVVDAIVSCEATLSSSLHGIIESHAYGVPSGWLATVTRELNGGTFKFHDYFQSIGIVTDDRLRRDVVLPFRPEHYEPDLIPPPNNVDAMARRLMDACPF